MTAKQIATLWACKLALQGQKACQPGLSTLKAKELEKQEQLDMA